MIGLILTKIVKLLTLKLYRIDSFFFQVDAISFVSSVKKKKTCRHSLIRRIAYFNNYWQLFSQSIFLNVNNIVFYT